MDISFKFGPMAFHAFKLIELRTNSSILAGKPAYTLIGTYQDRLAGLQKLTEVGTIIGDKAYSVQYIADAPKYSDYLPTVQNRFAGDQEILRNYDEPVYDICNNTIPRIKNI